ncbi:MAG: dephospho-CoA kinase [Actinobacteria bacterium BACL4 MAG-120820-bin23]|jgi:dephospho-CoA kinase|uniref:dephospho-CoA kinase n=1 Tax=Candidatus Nanopelagicus sp. TaxID=2518620 RepID=UPI0007130FD0|nr:MAG: dephospho-CoA kinase [Actinobacteria bacterium BACL4 MAG-120813-bin39]KRO50116.1 MAG: dephospho-CoA kinase [Actinobacteria bacterium BACL4 MAG-120820-bin23]KRO51081.1 MAG: dephospho-CoA kinase [Actinobacteria bacterium BACL4 MAG-121001-bin59]
MLIVALTGGIGSGKTTVGDIFSELGAVVIDSDQLARAVLERGTKGFDLVLAKFGDAILRNGELDRSLLATLVFNDSQKRSELESITHPLIRQSFAEIISNLPRESIVINQIPLLFESKGAYKFDHIITISAPEKLRIERLKNRGLGFSDIKKRIEAQATDLERESISNSIIRNDKDESHLRDQVESIWLELENLNRLKK